MAQGELLSTVLNGCNLDLVGLGFTKRKDGVFTLPVGENVFGWLGLNRAVGRNDGLLEINPVVGVRHQTIERLVAELTGSPSHSYTPPTLAVPLGYILPSEFYRPWFFGKKSVDDEIADMLHAIANHGIPFMQRNSSLESLATTIAEGKGIQEQLVFRIPIIHYLLGNRNQADESLSLSTETLGNRKDLAAQRFRSFASKFRELLLEDQFAGGAEPVSS